MNCILFEPDEVGTPLARHDRRSIHLRRVLRVRAGDTLVVGVIGDRLGSGRVAELTDDRIVLDITLDRDPPALYPITILIGHPRPLVMKRLFRDLTSLGVESIVIAAADLGERSYGESGFWRDRAWRESLVEGAEQAGTTLLPSVLHMQSLDRAVEAIAAGDAVGDATNASNVDLVAFDTDGRSKAAAPESLHEFDLHACRTVIAVGPERGFSDREREILMHAGFRFASLGPRVLRTESAASIAVSIVLFKRHLM